jgi:serine/threonine protein kinase
VRKALGEGAFGAVYLCKCRAIADKPLAVKKLLHMTKKQKTFNLNEIHFLSTLSHPTIVRYHGSYAHKEEIWIVTELLDGGPLSQAKSNYDESNIAFAAREILRALVHLHSHHVIHRDLKSENIMFSVTADVKLSEYSNSQREGRRGMEEREIRLCPKQNSFHSLFSKQTVDFGLAASVADGPLIQICGSPFWLSPEMIRMEPHSLPVALSCPAAIFFILALFYFMFPKIDGYLEFCCQLIGDDQWTSSES